MPSKHDITLEEGQYILITVDNEVFRVVATGDMYAPLVMQEEG